MVNGVALVEGARQTRRGVAILDAELAPRTVAIGVDRCFRHAQFAGDLLGRKMLIDQPQAFALTRREQPNLFFGNGFACAHCTAS